MQVARRRGMKKAIVALARRLAVIMHRISLAAAGAWHPGGTSRPPNPPKMVRSQRGILVRSASGRNSRRRPRLAPHTAKPPRLPFGGRRRKIGDDEQVHAFSDPRRWRSVSSRSKARCAMPSLGVAQSIRREKTGAKLPADQSLDAALWRADDPKHLGAHIGITAVLHTWGSTMTHHPHVHMIVPGGGISRDGQRWVSGRPRFLLPVPVLSRLFRGLFLAKLRAAHQVGHLKFFGVHAHLDDARAFKAYLAPLRKIEWYLYAKPPFGGPEAVLAYLSCYTHRVAISNRRLIASNHNGVTFRYKDYRADGRARYKVMTLGTHEFIRRFLIHVLPHGFHRIRHYGLFANSNRAANIARARELLAVPSRLKEPETSEAAIDEPRVLLRPCPCCGGRMIIIETFARGCEPKHQPETTAPVIRIDTS